MKRSIFVLAAMAVLMLAGGAFAAGQITGSQIKNSTITGKDVKNKSLTRKDFRGSVRGPRGFDGAQGPQGPAGPQGGSGGGELGVQVVEARQTVQPGDVDGPQAFCPAGKTVVGTGFFAGITDVGFVEKFGDSAGAGFINNSSIPVETVVQAICVNGSDVATARTSRSAAQRSFARTLAKQKAAQR